MDANKTALSIGLIIRYLLATDEAVKAITSTVFPVVSSDEAILPYVLYRRVSLDQIPTKVSNPNNDTLAVEVICYASTYAASLDLAEAVRSALDNKQCVYGNLKMRSCYLIDSEETWQDDAYSQRLVFQVKI